MMTIKLSIGDQVRVTQQVARQPLGGGPMVTEVQGEVIKFDQMKTGSWYAHGKDDKLWLESLILKKPDGEIVYLNLDQNSNVEVTRAASVG